VALMAELEARGVVAQVSSPELARLLDSSRLTAYVGFDPTADSLHLGNLLLLVTLRRLQLAGHRPILVAGGGTGMIGDPSGRASERTLLDEATLAANTQAITAQLARFLDFEGPSGAVIVDNREWLGAMSLIEFLREYGKHFSLGSMLAKESVRARMEAGISFTEFSYMVLQAIDFLQLFDRFGCTLQLGGSDQWGNITAGIELIRRVRGAEAMGLTVPLVTRADGTKFGKSIGGALWLDRARTTPYALYQFLVRAEDEMVITYLRLFTFVGLEEIEGLAASLRTDPERREPHHRLAAEVVQMVHSPEDAALAARASRALFAGKVREIPAELLPEVVAELPQVVLERGRAANGVPVAELAAESPLVRSRSELRRVLEQGGLYLNGERVGPERQLEESDLLAGGFAFLRRGKRDWCAIAVR